MDSKDTVYLLWTRQLLFMYSFFFPSLPCWHVISSHISRSNRVAGCGVTQRSQRNRICLAGVFSSKKCLPTWGEGRAALAVLKPKQFSLRSVLEETFRQLWATRKLIDLLGDKFANRSAVRLSGFRYRKTFSCRWIHTPVPSCFLLL